MHPNDKIEQQNATIANLVLEVAAERQRADMLLEQGKLAAAQVQAEQQRIAALGEELAAAKAAQPVQQPAPVADERAEFEKSCHENNIGSCLDRSKNDSECYHHDFVDWRWNGWKARAALATPVAAPVAMLAANVAQPVSDAAMAALKKLQRCMEIGTGCLPSADDQVVMQFEVGWSGCDYTELTFGDLRNLATLPDYSSANVAQVGELSDADIKTLRFAADALEGLDYEDTAGDLRDIIAAKKGGA